MKAFGGVCSFDAEAQLMSKLTRSTLKVVMDENDKIGLLGLEVCINARLIIPFWHSKLSE
jgi:hypothetical protein